MCALCPFVETALHFNGSIFQHGYDTESSVALLLLLLELSFALGRLLVAVLSRVFEKLGFVYFNCDRFILPGLNFETLAPEVPPPLSLRI